MHAGQLFSEHFLSEGVRTTAAYKLLEKDHTHLANLRQQLEQVYKSFPVNKTPDEAETEQDLIFRVLEAVGWHRDAWLVQPRAARKGRPDVPDMLLFPDADAKQRASAEPDKDRRFRHGVAVVESKRWDRPLDRASKAARKGDDEREVPSTQILRYLSRAETLSDRCVQWGVLTNGRLWRLYYQGAKSRSEEYFEIDLARLLDVPGLSDLLAERDDDLRAHGLRVFALMFGRASFVEKGDGDRTFHLIALDEGARWEEQVAKSLSELVFGRIFPTLVRALDEADAQRPPSRSPDYLRDLKDAALTLLYRLLFVLYAEDRDLLPIRERRYDDYGLHPIRASVAERVDGRDVFAATIGNCYARVRGLFRAIGKGEPSLGIPPYNGGLFDPRTAPLLERVELPDALFAPLLDALSRHEGRRINYRDLSVQQLGSIYERLLEHEVVERDGAVAVVPNEVARKGSGSFYTPEVLVQFILERTVGPLVLERIERFRERAATLSSDRRPKPDRLADLAQLDPATHLLGLKVCDPAMGSGHFLVSLVDFLADRVLEAVAAAPRLVTFADDDQPYESPLVERIAAIRARILQLAEAGRWNLDETQLDDRRLVRRMILKRVVHGADKNPMAVELAKVALWLHTFTVGAPLSFLDHHLRCGDSLLGLFVTDANAWLQERGALMLRGQVVAAQQAARAMTHIETITDSDIAEVKESADTFEGVREATEPLAAFLSLIAAERLMGVFDAAPKERPKETKRGRDHDAKLIAYNRAAALQAVLDGTLGNPIDIARGALSVLPEEEHEQGTLLPDDGPEQGVLFAQTPADPRHRRLAHELVQAARGLARDHRFLHWELAFPNVWREWLSVAPTGGFDAVIGNPPYVRQEQIKALKPALGKAYAAFDGAADLYVYFYELGLRLLRPGGRLSYVVTNKWLRAGYAEELRGLLSSKAWLEAVIDFGHAKRFFPGADVFPCVIVARRPDGGEEPDETEACQIPRDVVRLDRVSAQVKDLAFPLPRAAFTRQAWALDPPEAGALMDKIRRAGMPLQNYAGVSPQYGIKTGCNEAFLIDTPTRNALTASDPNAAEIIKPYLRGQDIERWYAPWRGLWMIFARRGIDIERYPSVLAHLRHYREKLEPRPLNWQRSSQDWLGRKPGSYAWYELQDAVDYYENFEKPKIVYNDITWNLQFSLDRSGCYINNTVYILPTSDAWVLTVLNAPIGWWFAWRAAQHGKDEALRYFNTFVETYPIPQYTQEVREEAEHTVERLSVIRRNVEDARAALADWYHLAMEIARPGRTLLIPFELAADRFIEEVQQARGKHRRLSAAGIKAVRDEYAATVQPMQAALREAERLERRLSDLVNEAYGLTPEEVRLMWDTAPPRMPLTPEADAPTEADEAAAD